jgi:hypothetical protein
MDPSPTFGADVVFPVQLVESAGLDEVVIVVATADATLGDVPPIDELKDPLKVLPVST